MNILAWNNKIGSWYYFVGLRTKIMIKRDRWGYSYSIVRGGKYKRKHKHKQRNTSERINKHSTIFDSIQFNSLTFVYLSFSLLFLFLSCNRNSWISGRRTTAKAFIKVRHTTSTCTSTCTSTHTQLQKRTNERTNEPSFSHNISLFCLIQYSTQQQQDVFINQERKLGDRR